MKNIVSFIAVSILADGADNLITAEDAAYNLACWREENVELPDGLTAPVLAAVWNKIILRHYPDAKLGV